MRKIEIIIIAAIIVITVLLELAGNAHAGINAALSETIQGATGSDYIRIIIDFDNEQMILKNTALARMKDIDGQHRYSMLNLHLREQAGFNDNSLAALVDTLQQEGLLVDFRNYWIAGMASAEAVPAAIDRLERHPYVEEIILDYPVSTMEPVFVQDDGSLSTGVEPGLTVIGADEAWAEGYDGTGRIVCNIDTGVDGGHPALSSKFRGNNGHPMSECWFDPYTGTPSPNDASGHGTHTMGIMVGSDAADTVGVAPGAQWIAAGSVDRGANIERTLSDIVSSFEWAADPDGNPMTADDRPDVINNSWGIPRFIRPECDEMFWEVIDNCEELGIVCIFAAGNEGPDPQTLRSPADRASSVTNTFAIGAVNGGDPNLLVAEFSSRGPSGCNGLVVKPQVVAPGVRVRSTFPQNRYASMSGTSMAAPHVAGAVAILRQARPDATVNQIKYALMESADDLGPEGPDFDYGYGIINIPAAIDYILNLTEITDDDIEDLTIMPAAPVIYGNYPNPFNTSTAIKFRMFDEADVRLSVYNIIGQEVATLLNGRLSAGEHVVNWDGTADGNNEVSSGVYFYRLQTGLPGQGGRSIAGQMTLLK